eukprot:jgi/Galph1/2918/GphlegSOOS_G1550.1
MSELEKEKQLQHISRLFSGYMTSRTLMTAVQLNIFNCVYEGNHTVAQVAKAMDASPRGTRMLLDALVALEFLKKSQAKYELTPISSQFLVKSSSDYIGAMFEVDDHWQSWSDLNKVVKTGQPSIQVEAESKASEFFPHLIKSLHAMSIRRSRILADKLLEGKKEELTVIDIACGSAVWSIPLAEKSSQVHVVAQDFPKVLETTKQFVAKHGVESQFTYLPGDLKKVEFGENCYDIAILGNIVHSEGETSSKLLLQRLGRAMKSQGKVIIVDMFPNDERTGSVQPLVFAINMLVNTSEGDTFTVSEYSQWLKEANIPHLSLLELTAESTVLMGQKD